MLLSISICSYKSTGLIKHRSWWKYNGNNGWFANYSFTTGVANLCEFIFLLLKIFKEVSIAINVIKKAYISWSTIKACSLLTQSDKKEFYSLSTFTFFWVVFDCDIFTQSNINIAHYFVKILCQYLGRQSHTIEKAFCHTRSHILC